MQPHILKSELSANIESSYNNFRKICRHFQGGLLIESEVQSCFMHEFNNGFYKFLAEKCVFFHFDSESYSRFLDDFECWQSGRQLSSIIEKPWLYYASASSRFECEASDSDRISFFELMKAFRVPPHYFRPIPDGIIVPDDHPGHFPSDTVVGYYIWEDDGGLLNENFKLGDRIILTDHYGLKAQIQVTERLTHGFAGFGSIEGYTSSAPKKINIEIHDGRICRLLFTGDRDDYDAFNSFPLWQDALEYRHMAIESKENVISDLMQHFMEDIATSVK